MPENGLASMKDTILWLKLEPRIKSDGNDLYSSIKDLDRWIVRNENLKDGERAHLYFQLLVEVNELDLPVHERLKFLEILHEPVLILTDKLSRKCEGSGLPLASEKSKFVEAVNTFWSEMTIGYKIIIDDLSESSFFTSFIIQKDLACALYYVLFYLNGQLYSNYRLYSGCSENVWRDIHQVFRFADKRNLTHKTSKNSLSPEQSIADLYKKILLFSLANPYHLSSSEMKSLWVNLDALSKYSDLSLNTNQVLTKDYPFIIKPYSDQPPFSNHNTQSSGSISELELSEFSSSSLWGLDTKKLIKKLDNNKLEFSNYFLEHLIQTWVGHNIRKFSRNTLIEPVSITFGVSGVSQLLAQINITTKLLKLGGEHQGKVKSTTSNYAFYQAFLIDESKKGYRLKLNEPSNKTILPNMGEVVAIKHADDSYQVGFLRWMRETSDGDVEFGVEHLTAMAEPVQLLKATDDKTSVLDSFVFPGSKVHQFRPILFIHTFLESFYNSRSDFLILAHNTGSMNINLVQKVDEVLDYSLYLFEKSEKNHISKQKNHKK